VHSTEALIIEQALNKAFYAKPDVMEEARFVKLVLSKNGFDKDRAGLHASAIIVSDAEFCYREQVLSLFYKQLQHENIPIALKRIFEAGNSIHEKWQRLFLRAGMCAKEDLDRSRFSKEYDLSFTPDGEPIKIGNHEYVAEIKSVNTYQFASMNSHPSGKKQLMLYMHLTGQKRGFVLADDKNTQAFKVFVYEYDSAVVAPYVERLEAIQEYKRQLLEERKMVARREGCDSYTCKRALTCNMRDACFNMGMGRVKLESGDV
jgi:hypothetical protein